FFFFFFFYFVVFFFLDVGCVGCIFYLVPIPHPRGLKDIHGGGVGFCLGVYLFLVCYYILVLLSYVFDYYLGFMGMCVCLWRVGRFLCDLGGVCGIFQDY
ncbi:hypothetical protein, partial [Enterobacter intestinihominis]